MQSVRVTTNETALGRAADIMAKRFLDRGISPGGAYEIALKLDGRLSEDAFRMSSDREGAVIEASNLLGAIHGCGRFLRACHFFEGGFEPSVERVEIAPKAPYRGVYLASHFHNYYHVAPIEELSRYLEDMALWGYNYIKLCYPAIDMEDEFDPEIGIQLKRHCEIFKAAHAIGMKTSTGLSVNGVYKKHPPELHAALHNDPFVRRGDTGNMLCLAKPGTQELVDAVNETICEGYKDGGVDMFNIWPYDEGGCGCPECAPWGAKGFIKGGKRAFEIAAKHYPNALRETSTWCFDTPYEGEWEALSRSLDEEKWCDVILADAHEDFPRYPLDVGVPGGLPMITFPEISMWGLFPWGGWGATMLPDRFSRLFRQLNGKAQGCFLYSEGIYEDVNKAIESQFYLLGVNDVDETLRRYAAYELGCPDQDSFVRLAHLIEKTHTDVATSGACDLSDSDAALKLAEEIDRSLPAWGKACWRWRIVLIRARLDARRYRIAAQKRAEAITVGNEHGRRSADWENWLADDEVIQADFRELIALFHCSEHKTDDPYHGRVRPMCR